MHRYIVNWALLLIPTLVGAAAVVFVLMRLIPGDICVVRLGSGGMSVNPRAIALCQAADSSTSGFRCGRAEIAARLPISLEIAVRSPMHVHKGCPMEKDYLRER